MKGVKVYTQDTIIVLEFNSMGLMNTYMEDISCFYEGKTTNMRSGHNFPKSILINYFKSILQSSKTTLTREKQFMFTLLEKHPTAQYIIGYVKGDVKTKLHELKHALYYTDQNYKDSVNQFWKNMDAETRERITSFLKALGYCDDVLIDEFQAYHFTEKPNFFGLKLRSRL